jgi:class 3 adenylate cyclase
LASNDIRSAYEQIRAQIETLHKESLQHKTAVMFSDLAGSTAYKSQRDQVVSLLKTYRHNSEIEEQVEKFRGEVVKSLGDGILSTFHVDEPDDIVQPIQAAIRIQKHFALFNRNVTEDEQILTRIGISCGSVIDFTGLNAKGKQVKDPQGSAVDLAARLCALAKPTQIIIDHATSDLLEKQTSFKCALSDSWLRSLKGFGAKVPVRAVVWNGESNIALDEPTPIYASSGFLTTDFVLSQARIANERFRAVGHSHRHFCDNVELYNLVHSKSSINKNIPDNVRIVCSQYPMAIPFVQADERLYFSLPFRSISTEGKREGVVDGPFFSTTAETDLGRRLLRNFEVCLHVSLLDRDETSRGCRRGG